MNVKFFYVRNPFKNRDITICSNLEIVEGIPRIHYGFSFRNNHDKFVKKEGRDCSLQRMIRKDKKYSGMITAEKITYYDISIGVLQDILNHDIPKKYINDLNDEILFLRDRSLNKQSRIF